MKLSVSCFSEFFQARFLFSRFFLQGAKKMKGVLVPFVINLFEFFFVFFTKFDPMTIRGFEQEI